MTAAATAIESSTLNVGVLFSSECAFGEGHVAPPPKKLTVKNDQPVLHRNSTENVRLFRVLDGNNPSDGDFHVGIVERCTQCLGVVGW